jgi:hypothetical protein
MSVFSDKQKREIENLIKGREHKLSLVYKSLLREDQQKKNRITK